ncbi:MAG TPA: glycosyltransferase family 87 protein, partial [Polyangiaceae bacterium]|nr:glycosyltransferase family 87 protein [Polyangiaceae bacterium]
MTMISGAPSVPAPALALPRSQRELVQIEVRNEWATLRASPLFWVGCALKLIPAALLGSHFATRWFAPFAYEFVRGHFANPWNTFLERGEPMAFPYGPGMLALVSLPFAPALALSFDPSSHLGLFLLRLPVFAADLTICVLLMRWLRLHARDAIAWYWLSPIVLYATYVHGQLDLIPTALLCLALFSMFAQRTRVAGFVFGFALATKLHLLIALPFALVFLARQRKRPFAALEFAGTAALTTAALYSPVLSSPAFRTMVFGSVEADKLWAVSIPYGFHGL